MPANVPDPNAQKKIRIHAPSSTWRTLSRVRNEHAQCKTSCPRFVSLRFALFPGSIPAFITCHANVHKPQKTPSYIMVQHNLYYTHNLYSFSNTETSMDLCTKPPSHIPVQVSDQAFPTHENKGLPPSTLQYYAYSCTSSYESVHIVTDFYYTGCPMV